MAADWFAMLRGKVMGPFTPDQLRGLVREGKLTEETNVRKGRDGDWIAAGRIQRLFEVSDAPAPKDGEGATVPPVLLGVEGGAPPLSGPEPPVLPTSGGLPVNTERQVTSFVGNEQTYINERGIVVTDRRLQVDDGTMCPIQQIAMVRRGVENRDSPWLPIASIVIGAAMMFSSYPRTPVGQFPVAPLPTSILLFPSLLGIAALGFGTYQLTRRKSGPWLLVSLSSGESKEINHPDAAFLDRVWEAISMAIRGDGSTKFGVPGPYHAGPSRGA